MNRPKYCSNCGAKLLEGARFCQGCGRQLSPVGPEAAPGTTDQALAQEASASAVVAPASPPEQAPAAGQPAEATRPIPVIYLDESHKERTAQEHYQLFKQRLGQRGRLLVGTKRPLAAAQLGSASLLIVGGPEHPWVFGRSADQWDDAETQAAADFVAAGGGLFFLGDGLGSVERMNAFIAPYAIGFSRDLVGDVTVAQADIMRHPITEGISEIRLGSLFGMGGYYLQAPEGQPAAILAKHNNRPVLICREYGRGRVVVMSSLSAFSNQFMALPGNSALLQNVADYLLARGPVPAEVPKEEVAPPSQTKAERPPKAAKRKTRPKPAAQEPAEAPPQVVEAPKQEVVAQAAAQPSPAPVLEPAEGGPIRLAQPPPAQEISLYLFGEEPSTYRLDLAEHVQQFAAGLPPAPRDSGAAEYAHSLGRDGGDRYTFDLPFAAPEPWSPGGYLRRLLYHLTQGRISYFVDAETERKRGGSYGLAWTAAKINQTRFDVRHPITFADESFLGEWPAALETPLVAAAGGVYLTTHRLLFAADQAWAKKDDETRVPLPFLSFWSKVDFSSLLRPLGMKGIPMLVEKGQGPLPDSLAPRMWFEPPTAWREEGNQRIIAITGWDLGLAFVEGRRGGDGVAAPTADQSWAFLGYRVTRTDGRQEFVAMIPRLIVPKGKEVEQGIRRSLEFLQPRTVALDALHLICFARVARDNGLLHSADPVSWPVPLGDAPQQI